LKNDGEDFCAGFFYRRGLYRSLYRGLGGLFFLFGLGGNGPAQNGCSYVRNDGVNRCGCLVKNFGRARAGPASPPGGHILGARAYENRQGRKLLLAADLFDHFCTLNEGQQQIHEDCVGDGTIAQLFHAQYPVGSMDHFEPGGAKLVPKHQPGARIVFDQQNAPFWQGTGVHICVVIALRSSGLSHRKSSVHGRTQLSHRAKKLPA
jgi:hypothetical protein